MHDTVDIVLATYNGTAYVGQQIDSIVNQTYPFIRLWISDDGSTDATKSILETYAKNYPSIIILLKNDQNIGAKANFSFLLENTTANYVMCADQDDVWKEDKVTVTLAKMKEMEKEFSADKPLLVHTDLEVVDEKLQLLSPSFWKYSHFDLTRGYQLNRLLVQNVVTGCTSMVNRALLKIALPVPIDAAVHDWWLALLAVSFGKIDRVSISTIYYRQHDRNVIGVVNFWSLENIKRQLKKFFKPEAKKFKQAKCLLREHQDKLNEDQKEIIEAYVKMADVSFLHRKYLILKHCFFYSDPIRNFVNILLKP